MNQQRPTLLLTVDYGQNWPLSDIYWDVEDKPKWDEILSAGLVTRLNKWAEFFTQNANEETGMFGSESVRRWFDLEGADLLNELRKEAGHLYEFELRLWF